MKLPKILLLALSLMLFSCSEEESVLTNDAESTFQTKSKGLTEEQVTELTGHAAEIARTHSFLEMRAVAGEFSFHMNFEEVDLTSREKLDLWLDEYLERTNFGSKEECLHMYDELAERCGVFLSEHDSFLDSLSEATKGQIGIILEPIHVPDPVLVTTSQCQDRCMDNTSSMLDHNQSVYDSTVANIAGNHSMSHSSKTFFLAAAESGYWNGVQTAVNYLNSCLGDC